MGLYPLGVPYPLFWGALGASLRFIPYLGPVAAAGGPVLLAMAALPGWRGPLEVLGFYAVLELFTNLVLETVLYYGAAGVSQVALLIAVAFWTWLWRPLGLILATPLTVCVVVMGKRVPALEFLGTLMSDAPALTIEMSFYQRLLAGDQAEAADLVDRFTETQSPEAIYDTLLIPALNYAEREGYTLVCFADLPPSPPSRTRLLVKRLHAAMPDLRIAVGRWACRDLADDNSQPLLDAGASHVASLLLDTRKYLAEAAPRTPEVLS